MTIKKIRPKLVYADENGNIFDHPELEMLVRRGFEVTLPRPDELIPLPPESELFLLPGRHALGFDPEEGTVEPLEETAVAAFACPGYTLSGLAAYLTGKKAPVLPLFAYGAVGYANDRFYVCASRVDDDPRQVFSQADLARVKSGARRLLAKYPKNRLISHLANCALTYCCPAARNLALGRYEAPLPTSRACNARCLGCISQQPEGSGFPATQNRIGFTPTAAEICEVMFEHAGSEPRAIFSFGQGCEGEPLSEAKLIAQAVRQFREKGGQGTVNINTNGSRPEVVEELAKAGVSSLRVSLNSARPELYAAYYRPSNYDFAKLRETIETAKKSGLFVSLNFLFHPGVSDTEEELEALSELVSATQIDLIQLRNLNLDPELYLETLKRAGLTPGAIMGLKHFKKRLQKARPGLKFGYFNPYVD